MRRRIGLEVTGPDPAPPVTSVFAPDLPAADLAKIAAQVDRRLAVTFLSAESTEFADAEDVAGSGSTRSAAATVS
jgi:hypothetical protein